MPNDVMMLFSDSKIALLEVTRYTRWAPNSYKWSEILLLNGL